MPNRGNTVWVVLLSVTIYCCVLHTVTSVPWRECQPIKMTKGLGYLNCSGRDLIQLPTLSDDAEVLDFSNNRFVELPTIAESPDCDPLGDCPVINNTANHCRYAISFSRNEISRLVDHALSKLRCLHTLDLSYNSLKASGLKPNSFQEGTHGIQRLILRGNPLGTLPDNIITQPFLRRLMHLDLSYCDLEDIGENSVDDFSEMKTLDLSNNNLKEIKPSTFKGLRDLRFLDLRHNKLQVMGHQVFADLVNLDVLLLSNNELQQFARHAFYGDSRLKNIDISFNKLTQIPYESLQELKELAHLIISYNPIDKVSSANQSMALHSVTNLEMEGMGKIRSLARNTLKAFPSLVTLAIRRNRNLKYIHPEFMGGNSSTLREVYLEYNELYTLSESTFPWHQLSTLQLQGNPWLCDYRLRWMILAPAIPSRTVMCEKPAQYKGRDIKRINPSHLQEVYPITAVLSIILVAISLPILVLVAGVCWRRRQRLPCCRGDVQGRYVTVFTRDDDDGERRREGHVDIEVTFDHNRLRAVSNGSADDTAPFIALEHMPHVRTREEEEGEEEENESL